MAHTDLPNTLEKIKAREKDVPWYNPHIRDKLGSSAPELENYSKIQLARWKTMFTRL
jgi:hypothetical protein